VKCSVLLSHSSCDCMCSFFQWMLMLWILSLGALFNTHANGHKHTHTCRDPTTHPQSAVGTELWQDLCNLTSIPAVCCVTVTLLSGCRLFLIGCCCDFTFLSLWIVALINRGLAHLSQPVQEGISNSNVCFVEGNVSVARCIISISQYAKFIQYNLTNIS